VSADCLIEIHGERLRLMPERAVFWERTATLLVADLHLGKATAFRAAGFPVPSGTTGGGLTRLDAAAERTGARRLVILGDLFHARAGQRPAMLEAVSAWRERCHRREIVLVRGNHDRHAGDPPQGWRVTPVAEPHVDPPFAFCHFPAEQPGRYALAGHLHPAVRLTGEARQRVRLPCFWFGLRVGVLPSFGDFTGSAVVRPAPGDDVFVVAGDRVVRVA
jgi:DNA ligase-associated metallophosphoesterase